MRKIWLIVAALALAAPILGGPGAGRAEEQVPTLTPDDRVMGKEEAPVTIVEYASFTCPHCAAFDQVTLPKLKEQWIDTGKAKLVFRDFPFDQPGLRAAMAARCLPPDRYYGFIDVLFKNQEVWARAKDPVETLSRIAKLAGMSQEKFDTCVKDDKMADQIVNGRLVAEKQYGVDSTPTFFINGKKLVGNQPYADFDKALTEALPKS